MRDSLTHSRYNGQGEMGELHNLSDLRQLKAVAEPNAG